LDIKATKILKGGRINIPKEYLKVSKLNDGELIGYRIEGSRICLFPVRVEVK